jgi:hypothetical protein
VTSPASSTSRTVESTGVRRGRVGAIVTAVGSAIYLAGLFLPIGSEVYEAGGNGDDARALALLSESGTQWDIAVGLGGLGIVIAAVGLWLLGRETAQASATPRVRRAGTIAAWLGLLSGLAAIGQIWLVISSPQEIVDGISSAPLVIVGGLANSIGLWGAFIGLGLALIWLPHLRVVGWILLVIGTLTIPTHAFMGPPASYLLLLVVGVVLAVKPVRVVVVAESPG